MIIGQSYLLLVLVKELSFLFSALMSLFYLHAKTFSRYNIDSLSSSSSYCGFYMGEGRGVLFSLSTLFVSCERVFTFSSSSSLALEIHITGLKLV